MGNARFKVVTIQGKNLVPKSVQKVRLKEKDRVCWVNPTASAWKISFRKKPLTGSNSITVQAGSASRWCRLKKGLNKGDIFRYRIGPAGPGDGPDGPAIISDGG
jgi:hypothetical protein